MKQEPVVTTSDLASDISDGPNAEFPSAEDCLLDPDAVEERFRVDRRKLEQMLPGIEEEASKAELFFQQIMVETDTLITWPSKLKIGAKSKKDPHIKISGKVDAVKTAKEKVMAVLDTKSNRVTLKMDVPFTDHSHIIGKEGNSIKKVMAETKCHIHFPDSNRSNPTEKSNQVSIAGEPVGVEKARSRIRENLPLVFTFDIPVTGLFQPIPDPSSPAIVQIQQMYGITVQFRQKGRVYVTSVMVRGNEHQAKEVRAGTQLLIDHLCGTTGIPVPVTMTMEVAQQHHTQLMGRANCNIKLIMQQTSTTIKFPDMLSSTSLILSPRKTTITITGSIEGVYLARQKLIGCLPLVLMFDMKEDQNIDPTYITKLMEKYDVYVSIKPKPKQPNRAIIVKGAERNVGNIFEARRYLLGLQYNEMPIHGMIPSTYSLHLTYMNDSDLPGLSIPNVKDLKNVSNGVSTNSVMPLSMTSSRSSSPNGYFPIIYPQWQDYSSRNSDNLIAILKTQHADSYEKASSVCSSTTSTLSSPNPSPRQGSPIVETALELQIPYTSAATSESTNGIDSMTYALAKSALNQFNVIMEAQTQHNGSSLFSNGHGDSEGLDKQLINYDQSLLEPTYFPPDYEKKKMLANKAMKLKPQGPESRIPTNSWSGYGFSKSMPEPVARDKLKRQSNFGKSSSIQLQNVEEEVDNYPWRDTKAVENGRRVGHFSNSSYIDGVMLPRRPTLKHTDLSDLLSRLGLDKYVDLFLQQEIDLATFLTMTDQDLKELGIATFGARRKMLLAISDLGKQKFSAAPGAERSKYHSGSNLECNGKMNIPEMAAVAHW